MLVGVVALSSCSNLPSGESSGDGGAAGWTTGGTGGSGATGGAGGTGGSGAAGGTGGSGGVGGGATDWFDAPGTWTELQLQRQPDGFRILQGAPERLDFPPPNWESCGVGCESTELPFGDVSGSVIVSTTGGPGAGTVAYAGLNHVLKASMSYIRRVVRLSDGATVGAFLAKSDPQLARYPFVGMRWESAMSTLVLDGTGPRLYGVFDTREGWDFKEPWDDSTSRARNCPQFDLDSSPPAYLFACSRGLEIMSARGSSAIMTIADSEKSVVGAGSHGLAVWAQHPAGDERVSRVRAWTPGEEARDLATLPGDVCGLAVGAARVVGFRGTTGAGSSFCGTYVTEPRFFWLGKDGGTVEEGPILSTEAMTVWSMSTAGNFMAAATNKDVPTAERPKSIFLVRLSDWTMRRFPTPDGKSFSTSSVAVDDEYLYFSLEFSSPEKSSGFERLYRYRLDHFDQIGQPFEPPR